MKIFAYLLDKLLSLATTFVLAVYIFLKFGLLWSLVLSPIIFFFFIPACGLIFAMIIEFFEYLYRKTLQK